MRGSMRFSNQTTSHIIRNGMNYRRFIEALAITRGVKGVTIATIVLALLMATSVRAQQQQTPPPPNQPAQIPSPRPVEVPSIQVQTPQALLKPLSLDEAIKLSLGQASTFEQAGFNERIAA